MIRKLQSGEYRLYSKKKDPKTRKRKSLGTFKTRAAAEKHERDVQYFKRRKGPNRTLGIAIYPEPGADIPQLKIEWSAKFPDFHLEFFDSRSHPLGKLALAIS